MATLIVARDVQTKQFATISSDWLTRFPGEFEKVRDVLDPITDEEKAAEQAATEQAATDRSAEIKAATTAADTPPDDSSSSSSSRGFRS